MPHLRHETFSDVRRPLPRWVAGLLDLVVARLSIAPVACLIEGTCALINQGADVESPNRKGAVLAEGDRTETGDRRVLAARVRIVARVALPLLRARRIERPIEGECGGDVHRSGDFRVRLYTAHDRSRCTRSDRCRACPRIEVSWLSLLQGRLRLPSIDQYCALAQVQLGVGALAMAFPFASTLLVVVESYAGSADNPVPLIDRAANGTAPASLIRTESSSIVRELLWST